MFGFYSLFGIKRKIEREKIGKHLHAKKPIQTLDLFFDIKLLLILILITKIENIGLENPEIERLCQPRRGGAFGTGQMQIQAGDARGQAGARMGGRPVRLDTRIESSPGARASGLACWRAAQAARFRIPRPRH